MRCVRRDGEVIPLWRRSAQTFDAVVAFLTIWSETRCESRCLTRFRREVDMVTLWRFRGGEDVE